MLKRRVLADLLREDDCVYLEAKDAITAAELERVIGKYVLKKLSERLFVINSEYVDKCRELLKKNGIFPRDTTLKPQNDAVSPKNAQIRDLIEEARRNVGLIRLIYMTDRYRETEHVIEPYNVNNHQLEGYCYLKNEHKVFRLDRIKCLEVLK